MLQQSILWGFWVSRLQYILCVMKLPWLFHINKAVGSNLSSPVGRGRGCCSLLKHICTLGPRSGFSSRGEPVATKQSYSATCVRDMVSQQLLRERQRPGGAETSSLSIHTQLSLSFLLQCLLCKGIGAQAHPEAGKVISPGAAQKP